MLDDPAYSSIAKAIEEGVFKKELASLSCTLCKASIQFICAESHLQGARHKKAVKNLLLQEASKPGASCDTSGSSGTGLLAAIRKGQVVSQNIGNSVLLTCVPCCVSYREEIPMIQHLGSEAHARNVKVPSNTSTPNSRLTVQSNGVSSTDMPAVQDVFEAIRSGIVLQAAGTSGLVTLTCSLCQKECNGDVTMRQHLTSSAHAKQLKMKEQRLSFSPAREPSVATVTPSTTRQSDSASPATTSTVLGNGVAQPMDKTIEVAAETDAYSLKCSLCGITCTGMEQLMYHKKGKSHMKKLKEVDYGELRDNLEDSPRSPIRIDYIQHEQSIRELTKDIRIYKPDQSLSDMFDEILAG